MNETKESGGKEDGRYELKMGGKNEKGGRKYEGERRWKERKEGKEKEKKTKEGTNECFPIVSRLATLSFTCVIA